MRWATPIPKRRRLAHAYEGPGRALCGRFLMTRRELDRDLGIPNRACRTCNRIADQSEARVKVMPRRTVDRTRGTAR